MAKKCIFRHMNGQYYLSSTYVKVLVRANKHIISSIELALGYSLSKVLNNDFIYGSEMDRIFDLFHKYGLDSWLLRYGDQVSVASHGPLGFAVLSAPTLDTAIQTLADYSFIRSSAYSCQYKHNSNRAEFILVDQSSSDLTGRWMIESGLHVAQQLIETVMTHPLGDNTKITFAYPEPPYREELEKYYGIPCEFNATQNAISIPASWCQIASPLSDDATYQSNLRKCEEIKLSLQGELRIAESIKLRLKHHFERRAQSHDDSIELPSLTSLASEHYMSVRTLTRRLNEQQHSYKSLLEQVRKEQASTLLKNTHLSVSDIGLVLGYQEPGNFIRAFKKWFKTTPTQWRKN